MSTEIDSAGLAKIIWDDPDSSEKREFVLAEGATASIGRSPSNDISIPERHVSRQHAVIAFRDGIFMISDLGSANGTFVNGRRSRPIVGNVWCAGRARVYPGPGHDDCRAHDPGQNMGHCTTGSICIASALPLHQAGKRLERYGPWQCQRNSRQRGPGDRRSPHTQRRRCPEHR